MGEKDTEEPDESSLELPSLFGRKKKRRSEAPPTAAPEPEAPSTAPARDAGTDDTVVTAPVVDTGPPPASSKDPVPEPTRALPEPAPTPAGGARKATRERPARAQRTRKERPARSLPAVAASVAALVVGAVVGLVGVGLTFGALQACDALTGTDSCGGPGLLVVLVVVVVMIMLGSALLRAFGVTEPGGLSFLGVAIFVAICLVFLLEHLLDPWMIVVGPVLCALGYGTAHWVVNRFNTELLADDAPEPHDVR